MKTIVMFVLTCFFAGTAYADIYSQAIKQAHNVANGQPRQGAPPPPPPAAPPNNTPPDPALQATLQNIANLRNDFDVLGNVSDLKSDSPLKQSLLTDLNVAAQGAKPLPVSVANLADHLATAVAGKKEMQPQHAKLAQDVHAIFNRSHLSDAQQQAVSDNIEKILQNGGVASDQIANVMEGITKIASETK